MQVLELREREARLADDAEWRKLALSSFGLGYVVVSSYLYLRDNAGIAHPENLLLVSQATRKELGLLWRKDAHVKVADFGFAKRVHVPNSLMTR